jgi:hypothetical protein
MKHLDAFKKLFKSSEKGYGVSRISDKVDEKGKRITNSWTKRGKATDDVWENHLNGTGNTLGGIPIMADNQVQWAAIDIDIYGENISITNILEQISDTPFVLCRSKSGGAHLYVFFTEPVPAGIIIEKMESFRAKFGYGGSEIFPKQHTVKGGDDDGISELGNFINLPYDGPHTLRYCCRDTEDNALNLEQFLEYANSKKITPEDFTSIDTSFGGDIFQDGPPCLNAIFGKEIQEIQMRNVALANAAVYFKKAFPEEWKEKLNELNQKLPDPLPDRELENIKRSYSETEYKYQCSKEPLCRFCDNRICRTQKYGIGYNEIIASATDLTQVETDPPVWIFVIRGQALRLSTDQLIDYRKFAKRCAEVLKLLPEPIKQKDWDEYIRGALETCKTISIPPELTPHGLCSELVHEFFETAQDNLDLIPHGMPYRDSECVRFKLKDLLQFLKVQGFNQLKPNEVSSLLTEKFKAEMKVIRVGEEVKKSVRHLCVPYRMESPSDIKPYKEQESPY